MKIFRIVFLLSFLGIFPLYIFWSSIPIVGSEFFLEMTSILFLGVPFVLFPIGLSMAVAFFSFIYVFKRLYKEKGYFEYIPNYAEELGLKNFFGLLVGLIIYWMLFNMFAP